MGFLPTSNTDYFFLFSIHPVIGAYCPVACVLKYINNLACYLVFQEAFSQPEKANTKAWSASQDSGAVVNDGQLIEVSVTKILEGGKGQYGDPRSTLV